MKTLLVLLAVSARAQEGASVPPPTEVKDAPPAASAPAAAPAAAPAPAAPPRPSLLEEKPAAAEPAKAEPAPAPKAEEPKPAAKPEAKPEPKAEAVKAPGADEEWAFALAAAQDADAPTQDAGMDELRLFVRRHPDASQAPEAMALLADLRQKRGEWQPAMTTLLRLLYEYPGTKVGLRAKSDFLTLVDKKAARRQRQPLADLVKLPETEDRADRLSALWQKLADTAPDALYEPAAEEIRDFSVRFPAHADADKLQAALAKLHTANGKASAAIVAWRKLVTLYPASPLCARARLAIGDLYADSLRDYKKAIDAYQDLAEKHPQAPELQGALESSARLFDEKLRQYDLAVEMHDRVVKSFPKTPASLAALKAIAKLQRERLSKPDEAIKTLMRLSKMHGGQEGVDALLQAADIARRDLKDFARQAELLRKVSDDYAGAKEAPQALFDAAEVYESDVKDNGKALDVYKEVASKFPSQRLAKKASDRAAKLEGK